MLTYKVIIGDHILYEGVNCQQANKVFNEIGNDPMKQCDYCIHKKLYVNISVAIDQVKDLIVVREKLANSHYKDKCGSYDPKQDGDAVLLDDGQFYHTMICQGKPTGGHLVMQCINTDTGTTTENYWRNEK